MTSVASGQPREALKRIAARPGQPCSGGDLEALRSAWKALDAMVQRFKRIAWCPCCHRPEVPVLELVKHVFECHLHPATVRRRVAADELNGLSATGDPLPPRDVPPIARLRLCNAETVAPAQRNEIRYVLDFSFRDAVELFATGGTLSARKLTWAACVEVIAIALDELDLYVANANCRCPACRAALSLGDAPQHVAACDAHPAVAAATVLEARLQRLRGPERTIPGWVAVRRSELELEMYRLLRANGEFLGRLRDDVGRVYADAEDEKQWDAARKHAAEVLRDGI